MPEAVPKVTFQAGMLKICEALMANQGMACIRNRADASRERRSNRS